METVTARPRHCVGIWRDVTEAGGVTEDVKSGEEVPEVGFLWRLSGVPELGMGQGLPPPPHFSCQLPWSRTH